eukprot:5571245-Pyramimonas_sp.AAC.1
MRRRDCEWDEEGEDGDEEEEEDGSAKAYISTFTEAREKHKEWGTTHKKLQERCANFFLF